MTERFCLLLLVLSVISARSESLKLETLKVGSTTYSNVTILGANATDLYFRHAHGLANVKLKYVGPDLQKRFNYDPKAAEAAEKLQTEEALRYENSIASAAAAQFEQAKPKAPLGSLGAETGLADAVSASSLLGKTGPNLEVDKWLGDKPDLEGKFVLMSFWAPWSTPCRQSLPELNALQKEFKDKLVIIGISSGPESAVADMPEPHPDFASAIDAKGKLSTAVGVTSVPCVMLTDPHGVVLYIGHPGALTQKKLQAILAKSKQ